MASSGTPLEWFVFGAVVLAVFIIDFGILNRKAKKQSFRKAAVWSAFCIGVALAFNAYVLYGHGLDKATTFLTAYLVEEALSIDNLFVFLVIFTYFKVPDEFQHRILFWGILSAMVMRAIFIVAGTALLAAFHWTMYVFGAFLVYTAIKLALQKEEGVDPEKNPILKFGRKHLRISPDVRGGHFFVKHDGKLMATPLFLILLVIEFTDLLFAVDSVPAVLAISNDVFIIYTSNIFAILGLRALYFVLSGMVGRFRYLRYGLVVVLLFIGVKMLLIDFVHLPTWASLAVIATVLTVSISLSSIIPERKET
ncbi:MAG: TerC family protein [Deltaproteobacteria bacterium]|nr:TerC family protein [Deltaproteobacteria bacterium]